MKKFNIKAYLASGLSFRLLQLAREEPKKVLDAVNSTDPVYVMRGVERVAKKIEAANSVFEEATKEIMDRKLAVQKELQAKYDSRPKEMSTEDSAKLGSELTKEFSIKANEIQKESKAKPDEMVTVEVSDEDYKEILLPVFKATVERWVGDSGDNKLMFVEVADSLENIVE